MKLKNLYAYLGQTEDISLGEAFWSWFTRNQNCYLFLDQVDKTEKERQLFELEKAVHRYNNQLFIEIGGSQKNQRLGLIITARGIRKHFQSAELLAELAPEYRNWRVSALKPATGRDFKLIFAGRTYDPRHVSFLPLRSETSEKSIALRICHPEYIPENHGHFLRISHLMLGGLIGEKAAALEIDYMEVNRIPDDIDSFILHPLCDVGDFIRERKKAN